MKINTHNVIVQCAGLILIVVITFNFISITSHIQQTKELKEHIQELEYKIQAIEQDVIVFENMHADHYGFEEHTILKLIDNNKADNYKAFLDSIKSK